MEFTKYNISGKDYIFTKDKSAFEKLTKTDITTLCNRQKGIGADGIFTFYQNDTKMPAFKGFTENGEIMHDFSSASICAVFEEFCKASITKISFLPENGRNFSVKTEFSADSPEFFCELERDSPPAEIFQAVHRKTEIGNRILTITPVSLHSIYAVHFTECREKLDIKYLGEHISCNSLFKKKASLILTEQKGSDSFDISYYENMTGCPRPRISAYGAVALAACRNGYCNYEDEITVSCNSNNVFVICHSPENITIRCTCKKVFTGNI